ncbi:MAG: ABC transporter permease [Microthrixaceae bacterium]
MREFVGFTITGLVTASIYAVVASGLTLTYATTGIFNWAHGALAAIGAFVYWQCTTLWGWPAPLAMILCVGIIGPVLGVTVESGIMRRLDGTNEITRMAVTLALLVGIIAGINWIWDPQMTKVVLPVFNGKAIEILGQRLPVYDLLVMAVALLVGIVMRWVLYRSRAGVQMRGIVDDRSLIILNGVSPVRTAQTSWVIGSTTAVLAGVLIAPKTSLSAGSLALLIMNAFAASVVGRLRSLPLTILGAAILGLSTAYAQGYVGSRTDLPGGQYLIGLVNVVPVVVLFIALQFLPQERLRAAKSQQARELSNRPTWNGSLWLVVAAVVVTAAIAPLLAPGDLHNMTKLWGIAVIALSLVPLLGWAGRLAVCPFAFAAVGALISAHLAPDGQIWGLVLAGVGAAAVGAILSFPGARLSPLYLALATAAFAVALDNWIFRLPPFHLVIRIPFTEVTLYRHQLDIFQGGSLAMRRPKVFGFDLSGDQAFLIFASIVFGASVLALTALRRSDLGLRMIALKDSPIGYATVGLNRQVTTVAAFAISAGVAGVGGALYGAAMQRPSPDAFNFFSGLSILVIVVVLGASTLGSAIGAGAFLAAPVLANVFPSLAQVTPTLTAAAGVGLGNNPNGSIRSDIAPQWSGVGQRPLLLGGGLAVLTGVYLATLGDLISNWFFAGACMAFVVVMPIFGRRATRPQASPAGSAAPERRLSASPEQLAQSLPLGADDLSYLDDIFGITPGVGRGS